MVSVLNALLVLFFVVLVALIVLLSLGDTLPKSLRERLERASRRSSVPPSTPSVPSPATPHAAPATPATPPAAPWWRLEISCPEAQPSFLAVDSRENPLPAEGLSIGRGQAQAGCMQIPGTAENIRLSRQHIRVRQDEQGFYLVDYSKFGIYDQSHRLLSQGGGALLRLPLGQSCYYLSDLTAVEFRVSGEPQAGFADLEGRR